MYYHIDEQMIVYVAEYFGCMSGAGESASDVLIALLSTNLPVTVISTGYSKLPKKVNGRALPLPQWKIVPRDLSIPTLQLDPDLVVVNSFSSHNYWVAINSKLMKDGVCRSILVVRESPNHYHNNICGFELGWAKKAMQTYSDFVFVSSICRDKWLSLGLLADKETICIPNCCREDLTERLVSQDRARVRQRLGVPADKFVGVCVASIQQRKGQDLLLDYFSDLLNVVHDLMIYLVGPILPGWGESLCQRIRESGFESKLQVLGGRQDALDFIFAADVLALPSHAEAMPRVILEAMALKTPVIASDVDGIPELIENRKTGLLFSHKRPKVLVDAFEQINGRPDTQRAFAERSYQNYWSNFSRAHQTRRYGKAIKKILK